MRRREERLVRLDAAIPQVCDACRLWEDVPIVDDVGATQRPERCPDCGRLVPVRTWVRVVGVPLAGI